MNKLYESIMESLPPVKNGKAFFQVMFKHRATTIDDFDGLLKATKGDDVFDTTIQGHQVRLVPNFFSDGDLYGLFINGYNSNNCLRGTMRKLIREWKEGKRKVEVCEFGSILMKNYSYQEK